MQYGSSFSNRTHSQTRVIFQFIVNVDASQSVSTTPSSGWIPSLTTVARSLHPQVYAGRSAEQKRNVKVIDAAPK